MAKRTRIRAEMALLPEERQSLRFDAREIVREQARQDRMQLLALSLLAPSFHSLDTASGTPPVQALHIPPIAMPNSEEEESSMMMDDMDAGVLSDVVEEEEEAREQEQKAGEDHDLTRTSATSTSPALSSDELDEDNGLIETIVTRTNDESQRLNEAEGEEEHKMVVEASEPAADVSEEQSNSDEQHFTTDCHFNSGQKPYAHKDCQISLPTLGRKLVHDDHPNHDYDPYDSFTQFLVHRYACCGYQQQH